MSELIIQSGADERTPTAICIMGPTATGKTDLAMAIHDHLPADIISVDSAMVYRDMVIGSAKPSPEELARAPHRLVDINDAADPYSAGRFREDALTEMAMISEQDRVPLLVGGTMLYFQALQRGIADLPQADAEVRQRLEQEMREQGADALHARLANIDPQAARRIHPNDPQRLQRALEVFEITGTTLSELWERQSQGACPYSLLKIALMPPDRVVLRQRITERFDAMLVAGFIDEVRALYEREDIHADLPSMRSVGYRQVWRYLDGDWDYATMREKAITATAQLAKRQMTWLRSEQNCNFIDPAELDVQKLLKNLKFLL